MWVLTPTGPQVTQEQENPTDVKTRAARETCGIPRAGKGEVVQGRPSTRLSRRLHKTLVPGRFYQVKLQSFWVFFCIRSLAHPSPAAWTAGNDGHVLDRGQESGSIPASRHPRAGAEPPGCSWEDQVPRHLKAKTRAKAPPRARTGCREPWSYQPFHIYIRGP